MWNISQDKMVFHEGALLKGEREDFLFYDVPILFAGFNSKGERIIGSFIDVDEEKDTENYLHAIVDEDVYILFRDRLVSYPDALRKARQVFVISWLDPEQKPITYPLGFDEIPEDYRPKEDAFVPALSVKAVPEASHIAVTEKVKSAVCRYAAKMQGGIADLHRAIPDEASETYDTFKQLIKNGLSWLDRELNLDFSFYAIPETASSFSINYEIVVSRSFFIEDADSFRFLDAYLTYILKGYPNEVGGLIRSQFQDLKQFNELFDILLSTGQEVTRDEKALNDLRNGLAREICDSTETLYSFAKNIGNSFYRFTLSNESELGTSQLATVGSEYGQQIKEALIAVNEAQSEPKEILIPDQHSSTFVVGVYEFNKRSGNGRVYIRGDESKDEKPTHSEQWAFLKTKNLKKKQQTFDFTQSLHEETFITITGRAKRRLDGTIAEIEVT